MPKILWMSPFSLHDTSSGAAIRCKSMLISLQKRGFETWSLSSFIFRHPKGAIHAFGDLERMFKKDKSEFFVFDDERIHYIYTRCASTSEDDFTLAESQFFYNTFKETLDIFSPDFVLGSGLSPSTRACFEEAQRRGITTVYNLVDVEQPQYLYPHINLLITDSYASAHLFRLRDHINALPMGSFINQDEVVATKRKPTFVTMVNPELGKGVALFAKIAEICRTELPDVTFLVVNTREDFASVLSYLHTPGKLNEHPFHPQDFTNVYSVEPQGTLKAIYSITKVLVVPSICFESWGRVASEALLNGIPVLASTSGALSEALCGRGIQLPLPESCIKDHSCIPTDEEIRPWIEALKRLLVEPRPSRSSMTALRRALSKETSAEMLYNAFMPFLVKKTESPLITLDVDQIESEKLRNIKF